MSDFPEILVHTGWHKTGSTSIQSALHEVTDLLTTEDGGLLLYPRSIRVRHNHTGFAHECAQQKGRQGSERLAKLIDEIRQTRPARVILSAEAFSSAQTGRVARRLRAVCEAVSGDRTWNFGSIHYVRSPASLLLSRFDQITVNTWVTPGLEAFLSERGQKATMLKTLKRWDLHGEGRIWVRAFSRPHLLNGDVVDDFMDLLVGRDHPAAVKARELPARNVGRPAALVLLMAEAKPRVLAERPVILQQPRDTQRKFLRRLRTRLGAHVEGTGGRLRWSRPLLEAHVAETLEMTQEVDRTYIKAPILSGELLALLEATPAGTGLPTVEDYTGWSRATTDAILDEAVQECIGYYDAVLSGRRKLRSEDLPAA